MTRDPQLDVVPAAVLRAVREPLRLAGTPRSGATLPALRAATFVPGRHRVRATDAFAQPGSEPRLQALAAARASRGRRRRDRPSSRGSRRRPAASPTACAPARRCRSARSDRTAEAALPESRKSTAFVTSRRPQPLYLSRPSGHSSQPFAASTSSACRSRILVTWLLVSDGSRPRRTAAAADTCGAANEVPSGWLVVADRAVGVALRRAVRLGVRQLLREGGEDADSRGGDVDEGRILVREVGNVARAGQRADADHVRQRRRPARVRPRGRVRLVGVADRGDDDRSLPHGVGDRLGLDLRVRVERGSVRVADGAEAEVDDARALVDRPADAGRLGLERDRAVGGDDLGHEQLGRVGEADDAGLSSGRRRSRRRRSCRAPGCPCRRCRRRSSSTSAIWSVEVGQRAVDAGVDDRDLHRGERRRRGPRVERVVLPRYHCFA